MNENVEEIEELLDDSLDTLADKKRFAKTMNALIKDCSKATNIEPKVLKAVKNYYHYKGANWTDNNPLEKDSTKKDKDKVSSVFIKLLEVTDNLRKIGDRKFLEPYIEALSLKGIHLSIDYDEVDDNKFNEIIEVLNSASKLQTNVDALNEEIKEVKSTEAEELNFTPKSSFVGVLGLLDKIKNGKDVDDKIQNNFTELTMLNNAYTYISAKNEEQKESEE